MPADSNIIKEVIYTAIGFIGAFISIIYWLLWGKRLSVVSSLWMIAIGWFIWWIWGSLTGSNLVAWIWWALSIETMHSIKELWPEIIKQKMKTIFNIK